MIIQLPTAFPEQFIPCNWRACFSPQGNFVVVVNWGHQIYCYPTQYLDEPPSSPVCVIDVLGELNAGEKDIFAIWVPNNDADLIQQDLRERKDCVVGNAQIPLLSLQAWHAGN